MVVEEYYCWKVNDDVFNTLPVYDKNYEFIGRGYGKYTEKEIEKFKNLKYDHIIGILPEYAPYYYVKSSDIIFTKQDPYDCDDDLRYVDIIQRFKHS